VRVKLYILLKLNTIGKLDYWSYEDYGALVFDNDKLVKIHANTITSRQ